ncbi:MAG TPA: EcsC family protein, partial [Terriglobia bacterium]|nr:EcsC family protein [Terriglobia bacterium]
AQLIIPSLILADVTTSMTLLSRHTCRIASTYGFSSKVPENLPHILAAMAPQTETSDEGYLAIKAAVVTSMRESSQFMSRTAGMMIDRQLLQREAPQMVRLISYVADRLGVVVTEKELGLLIPIAGAVLNSSINLSFQQVGHRTAQDYFRRLILEDRYGEELVSFAIAQEVESLTRSRN